MIDLTTIPYASNLALEGAYRLTLEQFKALPVPADVSARREWIYGLQSQLQQMDSPNRIHEDTITPEHFFTPGIYMRQLTMPAGTIIVGKRHAQEHLVTMTKGFCTCLTERGWEDMSGQMTFKSPAGEKRVLFIHEETTWMTVHRTDATTVEDAERDLILTEVIEIPLNTERNSGG